MATQNGRAALVTGASKGIGAEIARRLALDGFSVVVNYARGAEAADSVVREIEAAGGVAIAVQADVGDPKGVARLFDAGEQAFGGLDVLVNNAGIMKLTPLAGMDDADFDRQIAVNLGGVFRGMREGARRLRDGGRIISFSSSVVGLYQPSYGVYAATKAGVEAMTHVLAKELGTRGITVNVVAPGPVATELFLDGKSEALVETITKMIPLGRLGQPADIAGVVSFLAGPDGGWVNGQVLRANGGTV
ncbi:MAG: SDR family oxidoreductase [Mesorhizobium sp.]|uniref:SDR family oxidoreductase n=2 Tax=Mesorhizobium TaxID=68287 RepID=UPI000F75416C|nr:MULTISPECIES: SDR family oxidoreductase [unclassified Mesorhizobium]RUU20829.1 SDR family oxidoreductase [Mesorhizobium sp. M6A.T.Ca.TU.002.02.2.1]AZO67342.1 SDR family oxidoreductase [Mesorhizobium sp. M6A.T.Cr.TU.016.01.1.1]RWN59961.1 MAG: SDR family oxidoreductase [Mesorhizobium sp.]RWO99188.1 MAG: SDR family oxidoreductase [Mesorhizobium sp.]RWP72937.1 MAG: SDR family oxidoreductase [Mesorhizobium sp.]